MSVPTLPPNTAEISSSKRIRYNEVTAGATTITRKDLLNLVVIPDTTTTAYGLLKSCRILKIEIWSVVSTATNPIGTGADCTVTWLSNLGRQTVARCTQMGVAPGYLKTRPPENSLAGFWTQANSDLTEQICTIDAENGSIIDITFELIFANNQAARNFAITTGVVGRVSYNSFASYTPQGYQNYTPA